ncbi:probable peroxisomal acyl-coenzyme A oxidase 1 [Cloeon dipterum]|uniref:probable peroxisomal acyl-coenzyme A oxidase 1 n=1 Tax=Cloeon dipterum TaxID=197152 RepID=UPI0032207C22
MFGRLAGKQVPNKEYAVVPGKVNPDLQNERKKCTFDTLELTHFLDGGVEKYKDRKERENFFLSDPELMDDVPPELMSHEDQYRNGLKKACYLFKKLKELRENGGTIDNYRQLLGGSLGSAILKDGNPLALHYVMFIPTLMGQGTPDQCAYWIEKAWDCRVIGTYAQTELGHGTFIRGLETTATYNPKTQQFFLNSPTLTSYKWWPGGLGQTANYAVVVAQLYTKGECHGIHPFIVQLRDEKTHRPMPGVIVGEIGPKLGMNATNNGFLAFKQVPIPRNQMLMKNAQVLPDGTYVKSPSNKLTYGTMMFVRVVIVQDMASYLAKAVTIAVRYSAVRRQSEMVPGQSEPQIMDYLTQMYKLFPYIATVYALKFSAQWLWNMYNDVTAKIDAGDLELLPELHSIACCLKAVSTADTATAIETCRLSCGGHGYMACSNLPTTYGNVTAASTYEGENTVMLLQTARALMKAYAKAQAGEQLSPTVEYLNRNRKFRPWSNTVDSVVEGFKQIAAGKVAACALSLQRGVESGLSSEETWNRASVQLVDAAEAHCRAFITDRHLDMVRNGMNELSPALREVMAQLCDLYCVFWALKRTGDFLQFCGIRGEDVQKLQDYQNELLVQIRPNAVGLVDSFDLRDEIISSALGSYDGQVYERLLQSAMLSPLNAKPVHDSYGASLSALLRAKY